MNTFSSINQPTGTQIDAYVIMRVIRNLRTNLPFLNFTLPYDLGKNKGTKTARWFEFDDIPVPENPVPLVEGTTNAASVLTSSQTEVSVQQYGVWVPISDRALDISLFNYMDICSDKVSRWLAEALNKIVRNEFNNTGTTYLANGVVGVLNINTAASEDDLLNIITLLQESNVLPISEMTDPTTAIGTQGILPSYIGLIPSAMVKDLVRNVANFQQPNMYPGGEKSKIHPNDEGAYQKLRFISHNLNVVTLGAGGATATLRNTGGQTDVYDCYFMGYGAVGCTSITSVGLDVMEREIRESIGASQRNKFRGIKFMETDVKGVKLHVQRPEYSVADPYAQKGFVSGSFDFGVKILQDPAIVRYRVGISEN